MAVAGLDNAHLTWVGPTCGAPITGYTVTTTPGGTTTSLSGGTTHSGYVSGLTGGTSYTFTVFATNAGGNGPPSDPSNAVIPFDCEAEGAEFSSNCANGKICTLPTSPQVCVSPSYSASNGVVTDQVTGLLWQQNAPTIRYTWDPTVQSTTSAQYYCANLNLGGYSTGWRLPTLDELFSIVVLGSIPTINQTEFPGTEPNDYWTSTPDVSQYIWGVYFGPSGTYQQAGSEDPLNQGGAQYVRCVHDG
jgi:hypothetical protein